MGIKEGEHHLRIAERLTNEMGKRTASGEEAVTFCAEKIAALRDHLHTRLRPLLAEAIEAREEGINHLLAGSEAFRQALEHWEEVDFTSVPAGQAISAQMETIHGELDPVKRQVMAEVFVEDQDVLAWLQTELDSNDDKLKDVGIYLSSLVSPPEGEMLRLEQDLANTKSAIQAYRRNLA